MSLIRFALDRYQFTVVVLVLLAALGLTSYLTMPRSEDPQFNFPSATVVAVYPGASPLDVEQLIVDPLEEAVNELEDLKSVESTIRDGIAILYIEFLQGTDPDDALDKVSAAVKTAERQLPDEMADLRVSQMSPSDVNILQLALISESASYAELQRQAEALEQTMERIPTVKRSESWGFPDEQVHINLDFERIQAIGLSLGQVIHAVQSAGNNVPGGDLDLGSRRFNVKTSGDFESLDAIRRTVVAGSGSSSVYLQDVANVQLGYADDSHRARFNGTRSVFVTVVQREGTNIYRVIDAAKAEIERFETRLPDDIKLETVFDQSDSVRKRVNGFFFNLFQGIVLVGLIVFFALGLRSSAIVMLAIPFSLLMAIGWLDFSDFGLQQMSIVGLVIALGLLVDNAIVVTENVERMKASGMASMDAAVKGTGQVAWPIISATVTTVLAFLPMVLLQTGTGDFIRSMPLMVIYALVASLIVSLTLTPLLNCGVQNRTSTKKATKPSWLSRRLQDIVDGPYGRMLSRAVRRPGLVLATASVVFLGSMALFPLVGVSLFPKAEKPVVLVNIDLPEGSSLDRTDALARDVESIIGTLDGVSSISANIGHGNPRIYYNAFPKSESTTHAQLVVRLSDDDPESVTAKVTEFRKAVAFVPGATIQVKEFMQGPPVDAPIAVSVVGEELNVLRSEAEKVETVMKNTAGTVDVDNPSSRFKTDIRLDINREKAGLLGVGLDAIDLAVRAGLAGIPVSSFRDPNGEDYDVVIRMPDSGRPTVGQFDRMHVTSQTGAAIPVRQVASLAFESSPSLIEHTDLERIATVTADVLPGVNVAEATQAVLDELAQTPLPAGYRYHVGGEEESREESFGGMGQALIIALLGIFAVLVLQFRSFRQPLIVFAAIPFAITGAILALLITGYTFSFTAFIGLTSLVGIVVNNSIILVDYANHLRDEGHSVREAVILAGKTRFKPIILTTLTTIAGLLPLTLSGSTMWSPMGSAIIGGLAISTVLTLVVVPSLYALLTPDSVSAIA